MRVDCFEQKKAKMIYIKKQNDEKKQKKFYFFLQQSKFLLNLQPLIKGRSLKV